MFGKIHLGDRLILNKANEDLRRVIDLEMLVAATINSHDEASSGSREHLARVLARQVADHLDMAERAIPIVAVYFQDSAEILARKLDEFFSQSNVSREARSAHEQWRRRHPDFPKYLASLPEAAELSIERYREVVDTRIRDFSSVGSSGPIADSCGSSMFCAITGVLTGVAVGTGNAPAAIVGTAALAFCCTG